MATARHQHRSASAPDGLYAQLRPGHSARCSTDYRVLCSKGIESMFPILSIITFLPLAGGIAILFIPKERVAAMRWTALAVAWMDLLLALVLLLTYSQANVTSASPVIGFAPNGTFLYNERIPWINSLGISYSLGADGINLLLVALTTLLTLVCIGASFRIEQK